MGYADPMHCRLNPALEAVLFLSTLALHPSTAQRAHTQQAHTQKGIERPSPPSIDELRDGILTILGMPDEKPRNKAIRKLLKQRKAPLELWEKALQSLPNPPFALKLARGQKIRRTIPLHLGPEGILDTEVHAYIPNAPRPEKGSALLIASHGTGGQGQHELATWYRFAEGASMVILAASEQKENDGYRFSEQERQTQLALLRWARLHLPIDPDRVFVAGTSRGGHISWDLGLRYPWLWAGILPCIGGPRLALQKGQNNLRLLPNLLGLPIEDFQGLQDDPGLIWNLRLAQAELEKLGHKQFRLHEFPGMGHSFSLESQGLIEFFAKTRRLAHPRSLNLASARLAEARRSWIQIRGFAREVKDELRLKVRAAEWNKLTQEQRKRFAHGYVKDRTALVQAQILSSDPLTIRIQAKRVKRIRLLLPRWLWRGEKGAKLKIQYKGRRRSPKPKQDRFLYLSDFATHLDLQNAPVAYVDL
jgi:predicted esterase